MFVGGPLEALHGSLGFWKEGWRGSCSLGSVPACLPADFRSVLGDTFLFLCPFLLFLPNVFSLNWRDTGMMDGLFHG